MYEDQHFAEELDDQFYEAHDGLKTNVPSRNQINYGQIHASGAQYEQARYGAPLGNSNSLSSKFDDVCNMFKDTWYNWGMQQEEDGPDDEEEPDIEDDEDLVFEEIVDGDEPDTEEDFNPEDYQEVEYDEFDSQQHRQLKKVKVRYSKSRSSYTKTTKTNVYYKPPVTKKVYVPPTYKTV